MMRAGVLIFLFLAYQLWGTGLLTDRSQDRLTNQFEEQLRQVATVTPSSKPEEQVVTAPSNLPTPEPGAPVAQLDIPSIGSNFVMVQGVDLKWLQQGPGHFPQTPLPGQPGNSAVAGHRTTYSAPFNRIDELQPGDAVNVTTLQGTFQYRVDSQVDDKGITSGHFIVGPNDISILEQTGVNRLTLMACHPKFSAAQRLVVTATLASTPAPSTPILESTGVTTDASTDPLAGGDQSARIPAILWSLLAAGIWFATWWVARRWMRIPAYVIGTPIFLFVLFLAFGDIARLLPASY